MATTLTIDPAYGYVLIVAASSFILGLAHTANTGKHRTAAKVPYPNAYAPASNTSPEAHRFNCAQRAHANYVENQVQTIGALLIAGLVYPKTSAGLGALWIASRFMYMRGYTGGQQKEGKGRYTKGGAAFWIGELGLIGLSGWVGLGLVMGW